MKIVKAQLSSTQVAVILSHVESDKLRCNFDDKIRCALCFSCPIHKYEYCCHYLHYDHVSCIQISATDVKTIKLLHSKRSREPHAESTAYALLPVQYANELYQCAQNKSLASNRSFLECSCCFDQF